MTTPDRPVIDLVKCTGCGRCIGACPKSVITQSGDTVAATGEGCIMCAHCYCVCRFGAVDFGKALCGLSIKSFPYKPEYIAPGKASPGMLVNLVRSRRSIRRFTPEPVPAQTLFDLVEFAATAPSGSNTQNWEFTVLSSRESVYRLALEIGKFFFRLNGLAANPLVRWGSVPFLGMKLVRYYANNYRNVKKGLEEAAQGKDLLFHGATALILVHSDGGGSMPHYDAQYASYNITLLAHALGLGSCYIGYASESINGSVQLRRYLGIPDRHKVYAAVALGHPDVTYCNFPLRKPYRLHMKD